MVDDFDVLVFFGGVINLDKLWLKFEVIDFICVFGDSGKLVVVICYGLWILIDVGLVMGCKVILWLLLCYDLENVGVQWYDCEVVVDGQLIISCKLDDIFVFVNVLIEKFVV